MSRENYAIYLELVDSIKEKIIQGEYQLGERIMSERAMAEAYGLNRLTVRRALRKLEAEGCIQAIQGKGTFVKAIPIIEKKVTLGTEENVSLKATIKKGGMKSSRRVLAFTKIAEAGEIADYFPDTEDVYQLVRLSLVNDHPYAVQEAYFPCNLFQNAERFNFEEDSLYDYMDIYGHCPQKVVSYLQVEKVPDEYAEVLEIDPGKCIFHFNYFGFDIHHKITEFTRSYHKSEYTAVKYLTEV